MLDAEENKIFFWCVRNNVLDKHSLHNLCDRDDFMLRKCTSILYPRFSHRVRSRDCSDSPFAHAASLSPPSSWLQLGLCSPPCSGAQSCLRKVQQAVFRTGCYLLSLCLSHRCSVFLTAAHSPYTREIHVAYHESVKGSQSSPCPL